MHYTGMAAATFTTPGAEPDWSHAVAVSTLGGIAIGAVTMALTGAAILSATIDRRSRALRDARAISERVRAGREADARRIARELHDEVGSLLTSVKWELERLEHHCDAAGRPAFGAMRQRIDETLDGVRRIASDLRSPMLDELGLEAALEHEARQFERRTGITCRVDVLLDQELEPGTEQATALYRIVQEALTNVGRHAQATRVNVLLEPRDGGIALEIRDDGAGIPDAARYDAASLGLLGMRERAELLGGRMEVAGAPGRGTSVTVYLPLGRHLRPES
jgi:signal transduction histidine kinase